VHDAMAPPGAPEGALRQYFAGLGEFRDELGLTELSIGMSRDFKSAIEEGATLLGIGSASFRPMSRESMQKRLL
jgi:uncharacterized pyridoxal phosphate-containing UPF0001 family protein